MSWHGMLASYGASVGVLLARRHLVLQGIENAAFCEPSRLRLHEDAERILALTVGGDVNVRVLLVGRPVLLWIAGNVGEPGSGRVR